MREKLCERCQNAERAEDYTFCHECIHEMITPGFRAPFLQEEDMKNEIRRANGWT